MLRPIDSERIVQIRQLLMKLSTGDFSYQIERSEEDDDIEALVVLVNLMAEEMRETLRYYSVLGSKDTLDQYVHMVFVLDTAFEVQYANATVLKTLGKEKKLVVGQSFSSLLSKSSILTWKTVAQSVLYNLDYHAIHSLAFTDETGLTQPFLCAITNVQTRGHTSFVLVTTFETIHRSLLFEDDLLSSIAVTPKTKTPHILTQETDIRIIQQVRDYILQHLEYPLPRLKSLAHQFGTNEFKLKYGFKQLYGISVFRFLTRERLKRARLLIQNTSLPLKSVAKMTGFKNVSHFSKAFKLRFGVSPSHLRKK